MKAFADHGEVGALMPADGGDSEAVLAHIKEEMKNAIIDNLGYAHTHGTDRSEIADRVSPY